MATLPQDLDGVEFNFIAPQGFSYDFKVTILDEAGAPVDLTGETVELAVKAGYKEPVALLLDTASSPSTLTITDPTDGEIFVHFDGDDTLLLSAPRTYVYDLKVGEYRKVWGNMMLRPGVTTNA